MLMTKRNYETYVTRLEEGLQDRIAQRTYIWYTHLTPLTLTHLIAFFCAITSCTITFGCVDTASVVMTQGRRC